MEKFVCKEGYISLGGRSSPLFWLSFSLQIFAPQDWFNIASSPFRVSGLLWHCFKQAHQSALGILQYTAGLEVLACSIDTNLNYYTIYSNDIFEPVVMLSLITLCVCEGSQYVVNMKLKWSLWESKDQGSARNLLGNSQHLSLSRPPAAINGRKACEKIGTLTYSLLEIDIFND